MSAANPNPMEKSMVSVLVVANAGGGRRCRPLLFNVFEAGAEALCDGFEFRVEDFGGGP
jgi:hypothetical protein